MRVSREQTLIETVLRRTRRRIPGSVGEVKRTLITEAQKPRLAEVDLLCQRITR